MNSMLEKFQKADADSRPVTFMNITDLPENTEFAIREFKLIATKKYGPRVAMRIGYNLVCLPKAYINYFGTENEIMQLNQHQYFIKKVNHAGSDAFALNFRASEKNVSYDTVDTPSGGQQRR